MKIVLTQCLLLLLLIVLIPSASAAAKPEKIPYLTKSSLSTGKPGETITYYGENLSMTGTTLCTRYTNREKTRYENYKCPWSAIVRGLKVVSENEPKRPITVFPITGLTSNSVTVWIPENITSGSYDVQFWRHITEENGTTYYGTTGPMLRLKVVVPLSTPSPSPDSVESPISETTTSGMSIPLQLPNRMPLEQKQQLFQPNSSPIVLWLTYIQNIIGKIFR